MISSEKINKILLIKLRAIGDVVLSTIVLKNLREYFPDAEIDFLTESYCRDVIQDNNLIDEVITLNKKVMTQLNVFEKISYNVSFLKTILNKEYDLVFDFFGNPRSALLTFISGARYRIGYNYRIRKFAYNTVIKSRAATIHEAEWHLDALKACKIPIVSHKLSFQLTKSDHKFAQDFWQANDLFSKSVFAVNFSGGWMAKRWPLDHFAKLAEELIKAYKATILIIWGPGEEELAMTLQKKINHPILLIPHTNLKQLGAILNKCTMMITTDSGPMHIAAALETPCVAIFGPTNPSLQGPYGTLHRVVRNETLACLGCNRITCDHVSCMKQLSVDHVFQAVNSLWNEL